MVSVVCLGFVANGVKADSNKPEVSEKVTVNVAHVSLMHPYLEPTTTSIWEYFSGGAFDTKTFQKELYEGWQPDGGYSALKDIVEVLDKHDIDVVTFAGVRDGRMARHLVYYLYSQAALSSLVPVSGYSQEFKCDLCRRMSYDEYHQALIFSRYPLYDKFTSCDNFKLGGVAFRGVGCFLSVRVMKGKTYFTLVNVNVKPLDELEKARKKNWVRVFITKSGFRRKEIINLPEDYLRSVRKLFEVDDGMVSIDTRTTVSEVVVYTGFWGAPISKVFSDSSVEAIKGARGMLSRALNVKMTGIPKNLTSLDFSSNKASRQWYTAQGMPMPLYDALTDFIAVSAGHASPLKVSDLKVITPVPEKVLPGHKIVYRTITVKKPWVSLTAIPLKYW